MWQPAIREITYTLHFRKPVYICLTGCAHMLDYFCCIQMVGTSVKPLPQMSAGEFLSEEKHGPAVSCFVKRSWPWGQRKGHCYFNLPFVFCIILITIDTILLIGSVSIIPLEYKLYYDRWLFFALSNTDSGWHVVSTLYVIVNKLATMRPWLGSSVG